MSKKTDLGHFKKATILILCHRRTQHLQKVLDSLLDCANIDDFITVFVVQDPIPPVMKVVDWYPKNKRIVIVDGSGYTSPAQAINGNLFKGLDYVFGEIASEFTIVLEDDIVVSKDALFYYSQVISQFNVVKHFRGVNGFSTMIPSIGLNNAFVRTHFGLGWGWAIDKRNFKRIMTYWKGNEDDHWDFIFEPYIRTGFVVNPLRSRIHNIGFDETATHTGADTSLGHSIHTSFNLSAPPGPQAIQDVDVDFLWRGQILNHSKLSSVNLISFRFLFFSYFIFGNSRIYHRTRRFFSERKLI